MREWVSVEVAKDRERPSDKAMAEGKQLGNSWAAQKKSESARIDGADPFYMTSLYTFSSASDASWRLADDNARNAVFIPGFVESLAIIGLGLWWVLSSLKKRSDAGAEGRAAGK